MSALLHFPDRGSAAALAVALVALVAPAASAAAPGSGAVAASGPVALAARASLLASSPAHGYESGGEVHGDDWAWAEGGEESASKKKSALRAVASSALLPGLGESYLGYHNRAKFFYVMEGIIWSTFAFYRIQADDRQDRQIEYAEVNAGAPGDGDSDYYEHIGLWISLEEWHDIVRRDARLNFPDDPDAQEAYFQANKRYDQGDYWNWPDDVTRTRYRQLRSEAERSYRNARLALGAALFDRIASMVHCLALTRSYNNRVEEEELRAEFELRLGPKSTSEGLVIGPVLNARY